MGSDGNFYTQDQMREIIAYARDRGIRVLPEFDIPGHTGAWFPGYPALSSREGKHEIVRRWGVIDSCLDPTREETYRMLDGFIGEMAALFPDPFFHIGGDEVNGVQWNANPRIVEFKKSHGMKDNQALQAYFNKRVQAIVAKHGKTMIGWDEILHPDLPRSIVIQSWRGPKSLAEAARGGYRSLLSSGYYLDLNQPAAQHYAVEPISGDAASLSPAEQEKILGGEACMWAEYVTPENIDLRIWPRAAAVAERFWSPAGVNDPASMYARMELVSRKLSLLGLTHRTNYPPMLERMAGAGRVETVKSLADVVEPVKDYAREGARNYTSTTPLNRMVDTAASESLAGREFAIQVDALLRGSGDAEIVQRSLTAWRDYARQALPLLLSSTLLEETAPVAENLSAVAAYGLQALEYFRSGKPAPAAWYKEASAAIARAGKPNAELLLMTVAPTKKLVEAVRPADR
jgi:hexosaminidase